MTTTTSRRITHTTEIAERLPPMQQLYGGAMFRPDRIVEVVDWDTDADGGERVRHYATVHGAALTKTGKDHATNRGKFTFYGAGGWLMGTSIDAMPDSLKAYVRGTEAMLTEIGWSE